MFYFSGLFFYPVVIVLYQFSLGSDKNEKCVIIERFALRLPFIRWETFGN